MPIGSATRALSAQRGTTCPRAGRQVRTSKEVSTSGRSQGSRSSRRAPATTWRSRRRLSDREGRDGRATKAIAPSGRWWLLPSSTSHVAAARQVAAVRGKAVMSAVANRTVRARVAGTPLSSAHRTGSDPALVVSPSRCHWRADRWPRRRWMWQPHSVLSRSSSLTRMKLIGLASSFGSMRVAGACGGACSRHTSCGLDQRMVSRLERAALGLRCVPGRSRFGRRVGR